MEQTKLTSASRETQELLDLCAAIVEGDEGQRGPLRDKVAQRQQELSAAVDDFFGQVNRQGEEYHQRFQAEFEEIELRFREYEAALEKIQAFLEEEKELDALWEAAGALAEASHFLRVAMGRYEQADMSTGPSKFPLVNLLDNLGRGLREGKAPPELWEATCVQYLDVYRKTLEEIEKSQEREAPGVPEREKAVQRILELFEQLRSLSPGDPSDRFSSVLSDMTTAHLDLENAFNTYNEAVFTRGPTRSPRVNLVLNAAAGYREGRYTGHAFKLVVEDYLKAVRSSMEELQPALKAPPESAILNEEMARMLESMEGVEDALVVLSEFAGDPDMDPERVEDALALLEASGEKGAEATAAVQQFNESAGKVLCVHCQTENPLGTRICAGCQRSMPLAGLAASSSFQVMEGGVSGPDFTQETIMTDVMKALFDECDAYARGEVDPQRLEQLIDSRLSEIERAAEKLSVLQLPEIPAEGTEEEQVLADQFVDIAEDALDLLDLGLEECREGLEKIRKSMESGDSELMQEGKEYYFRGSQKMWQVWRLDNSLDAYLRGEEVPAPHG
ncbi:MAG: hypothetical protein HY319_27280 [Armatimonadetes bacterium]|nr:hypothetical protein [Armatimonadota bacterium]